MLNKSDYIIFSPNEMDEGTLIKLHNSRFDKQIWMLKLFENPENTEDLDKYNNFINFTSSYRWDSDIVVPYGKFITSDDERYINKKNKYKKNYRKINDIVHELNKKNPRIAMFVSNCFTKNFRLNYTYQISKYYPVDVYGKCGDKTINRQDGFKLLKNKYKYYLAFENGNCQEYVTEKFFINALENYVIPIVLGPSKEYYEKIAPINSFIHINDFKNAKDLSLYLKYLDDNPREYFKYFEWINNGKFIDTKFWCRLCVFAQNSKKKIYTDINKWWKGKKTCDNAKSQWKI
uniref:Fucosyltransferase n=1 Tax=Strongyloides venezuelensis TaxID=75913 RepID=A0A0K0EY23_STRVS